MIRHRVVVIGAGMGGLVSALQLAAQGMDVTVVEAAAGPGGKVRQIEVDGAPIDSGPTVMTMRWVFDQILGAVGADLDAELKLRPLSVLARHWWDDGSTLDLHADAARSADAVGRFAGAAEARRFEAFCAQAREVYRTLEGPYIRDRMPGMLGLSARLGPRGIGVLAGLGPMTSLWRSLGRHFHDPRLRQLFGRYATYTGSSPWQAPATLMLIAQVELDGVWSIDGGMHALARCLERLARSQGAVFRYHSECARIQTERGRVSGVLLASGERLAADSVVFNGDIAALRGGLLGPQVQDSVPARAQPRSLSALTWSIHTPTSGLPLDRHNVFFRSDYASEFSDIFGHGRLPSQPTVYVCAQDRGTGTEPAGAERLLCLVNAPALGDQPSRFTPQEIEPCQTAAFNLLRRCGLRIRQANPPSVRTTPADFHRLFPATGGALYGQATHGWMSAFARPNAGTPVDGLFLAGGSVHPGPGVPMAALSGLRAAEALLASRGSTRWSPRVATSGGTSMP